MGLATITLSIMIITATIFQETNCDRSIFVIAEGLLLALYAYGDLQLSTGTIHRPGMAPMAPWSKPTFLQKTKFLFFFIVGILLTVAGIGIVILLC